MRQLHTLNKTMLQQAIFVPPGYTSLLYAHGHEDNSCPYNTALFKVIVFCMLLLLGNPRGHILAPLACCLFVNRQHMFPVNSSNAMLQQYTCSWGLLSLVRFFALEVHVNMHMRPQGMSV